MSSFARRRRGSSTSLHNFSDNEEESGASFDSNGASNGSFGSKKRPKIPDADSVSLTGGSSEPSHR